MLLTKTIKTKVHNSTIRYYENKGYGRFRQGDLLTIKVEDLPRGSGEKIVYQCDDCGKEKTAEWFHYLNKRKASPDDYCINCQWKYSTSGIGNSGEKHYRWKNNSDEKKKYFLNVLKEQRKHDLSKLQNSDKKRTVNGVSGGFQLDHVLSISQGFYEKIPPQMIGHICNLRFLPWNENREKWDNSHLTLEELAYSIERYELESKYKRLKGKTNG